jgi:hypothetical protein
MSFVTNQVAHIPFVSCLPAVGMATAIRPVQASAEVRRYSSLMDLADALRELDWTPRPESLHVVIVLDDSFCGSLASLARREQRADRLTIVTEVPFLAGVEQAYALEDLCWSEIVIEQGVEQVLDRELQSRGCWNRVIVFLPQVSSGAGRVLVHGLPL